MEDLRTLHTLPLSEAFLEAEFWVFSFRKENYDIFLVFFPGDMEFRGILGLADFVKIFIQNIAIDWLSHSIFTQKIALKHSA